MLVYDVSNKESFDNIKMWWELFQQHRPKESIAIIVGNKIDLPRKVSNA